MDVFLEFPNCVTFLILSTLTSGAVPPEACFANFRWDDCGRQPVPKMYYYKPGSRCEVGIWRGCLPNMNMFDDEYECINTCIFVERAKPEDYHAHLKASQELFADEEPDMPSSGSQENITDTNGTDILDVGNVTDTGNVTTLNGTAGGGGGGGANATNSTG